MEEFLSCISQLLQQFHSIDYSALTASALTSFMLITAAEIGDKSQLVCMTLSARYRSSAPVIFGAILAFAILNGMAVIFGLAISTWLPDYVISGCVAALFAIFGGHALFTSESEDEDVNEKSGHGLFLTTFLLITIAEFGDKTQLAVVALSSTYMIIGVWLGATMALAFTSILAVVLGRAIFTKIPISLLHKISGLLFISLALVAAYRTWLTFNPAIE